MWKSYSNDANHSLVSLKEWVWECLTSREKLNQFIQEKLPEHKVNPASVDDMCMLHAFCKGINTALGKAITLDEITKNLRKEFLTNYTKLIDHLMMILSTFL